MDLTKHLTTRADDGHASPVFGFPRAQIPFGSLPEMSSLGKGCQALVRFIVYHRIKDHAPPLVRVPVNSFMF